MTLKVLRHKAKPLGFGVDLEDSKVVVTYKGEGITYHESFEAADRWLCCQERSIEQHRASLLEWEAMQRAEELGWGAEVVRDRVVLRDGMGLVFMLDPSAAIEKLKGIRS